jgi:hypothetical protein
LTFVRKSTLAVIRAVAQLWIVRLHYIFMNSETKQLLTRWQSLEKDGGLQRAVSMARVLWVVGLVLFLFVVIGLVYRLHPALIAVAAAIMGWVIAERNALRTRAGQWPIFKNYIDWNRVHKDLSDDDHAA